MGSGCIHRACNYTEIEITAGCSPLNFAGVDHVRTPSVLSLPCHLGTTLMQPSSAHTHTRVVGCVAGSGMRKTYWRKTASYAG